MVDFTNTLIAFQGKTNHDLLRAKILFKAMGTPQVISMGKVLTNLSTTFHLPTGWVLRNTIYKQFVGGEDLEKIRPTLNTLMRKGVRAVLDYSAEGGDDEQDILNTYYEVLKSFRFAKENPAVSFTVFKPSGLVRTDILEKKSMKKGELSPAEKIQFNEFTRRFMKLCEIAANIKVPVLVDAEHYCYQDVIDELTEKAMKLYNKEHPYVFATLQMYRHDRMDYLKRLDDMAQHEGFIPGIKFVRGAYMEQEREKAAREGYPDPICKNKRETDDNFDEGVKYVLERIDRFAVFVGTHNEESIRKAVELIDKLNIDRNDPRVMLSQLYGMSDILTYNLANEGYRVCKYVPYAPVNKVLPYLIRRAEENTAIAGQTSRELELINKEINRRKKMAV